MVSMSICAQIPAMLHDSMIPKIIFEKSAYASTNLKKVEMNLEH